MKERVQRLLNHPSEGSGESGGGNSKLKIQNSKNIVSPSMGTFHAICAQILRHDIQHLGRANNFIIFDTLDQTSLIRKSLKEVAPVSTYSPRAVLSQISKAKNDLIGPEAYAAKAGGDYFQSVVAKVYPRYAEQLKDNEALDFDDLLLLTVELFRQHPHVLQKYQHKWQYILIDEYQDTNQVQYLFAKLLAEQHHNLCVVGDDDQSIYGFRGANVGNILAFEHDYPETQVVKLEQNYRSTQPVLDVAYEVISRNEHRTDKRLWTDRAEGEKPVVYEAINEVGEAGFVIDQAKELQAEHLSLNDMAILYRTNAQSRAFEEACMQRGVPYRLIGGVKFYERKEIKDLLAFLRYIYNPEDQLSFERIVNVPPRGIGTNTLQEFFRLVKQYSGLENTFYALLSGDTVAREAINSRGYNSLGDFYQLAQQLRAVNVKQNLLELFDVILKSTDYLAYINDGTPQAEERFENIQELRNAIATYTEYGPQHGLALFLEEVSLMTDLDTTNFHTEAITLITIHAVKGLEFDVVFLTGMEEGLFPHSRSLMEEKELEEERRLCYVGVTRAKRHLYLTHAQTRSMWGETRPALPSRFLNDIPDELVVYESWEGGYGPDNEEEDWDATYYAAGSQRPEPQVATRAQEELRQSKKQSKYREGQKVRHATFGSGVIVQIKDDELTVVFEKAGMKRLLESMAPLESV